MYENVIGMLLIQILLCYNNVDLFEEELMNLKSFDPDIKNYIDQELQRQTHHIELIASENFVSKAVLEAQGSILTNKYAEGYPHKRYYGGCEVVDLVEETARERLKVLFDAKFVNVQPHSGSQANMAVYMALLNPGDKILGMSLNEGGHLTHGFHLNFSGKLYHSFHYGVSLETERIDYDAVRKIALEIKPQLIVAGASAYSRTIDFAKFRAIADEVGAYLMVDMAHIAGLIAAKLHPSPLPHAHVVTSTTHKTLRGPRGGIILTNDEDIAKKIDRSVFPGMQGGPLMHVIAAKAVAFKEALSPSFVTYQKQVVENAKALAKAFEDRGYPIISGGTDTHLFTINVKKKFGMTGKKAEDLLNSVGITCNKNTIPNDSEKPAYTSGIRLGTPAVTTRGFKAPEMELIAALIDRALSHKDDQDVLNEIKEATYKLTKKFPLYEEGA